MKRLCSISLLPREADEDIQWAKTKVEERRSSQLEIFNTFVERLTAKGITAPGRASFYRWASSLPVHTDLAGDRREALVLSANTRRLLAAGLRALADDLEDIE